MAVRGEPTALPEEAAESIILAPDEEVMNVWRAFYKYPHQAQAHNTISLGTDSGVAISIGAMSGYVVLTNRRLAFIRSKGLLSTSYSVALAIFYEDILGIDTGRSKRTIRVSYKGSFNGPAVLSDFMDPHEPSANALMDAGASVSTSEVKKILSHRITSRLNEIEAERNKAPTQIVIDFNSLKFILEKGGITVQSIKCPACGADIGIPEAGSTTKCEYCGSQVKAIDLLERIKELIDSQKSTSAN